VTSRAEKIEKDIDAARAEIQHADEQARAAEKALQKLDTRRVRADALQQLQQAMAALKTAGGECPVYGDEIKPATYDEVIARTRIEIESFETERQRLTQERDAARKLVGEATARFDALRKQQDEEQRKARQAALDAYRKRVAEEGFKPREGERFYRSMRLPWGGTDESDKRLRRVSALVLLFTLLLGVGITMVIVPVTEREEAEIPQRLAQLLIEKEKAPEPPKPKERTTEQKTREKAPEPTTAEQAKAREKARSSGLLAFSDALDALKQTDFDQKLGNTATLSTGGRSANEGQRSIITAKAEVGSGGINTANLSRGVGSGGLGGRSTSKVSSSLADQVAANADRRIVGTGKASRTDEEIQIVFDRYKSALYSLYNRELRQDPTLQGKIVLKLTILPSGAVSVCTVVSSSLKSPGLERKIAQRVQLFNFGAKDVDAVTITYPIDFLPA
jgi:TonB family protein